MKKYKLALLFLGLILFFGCGSNQAPEKGEAAKDDPPPQHLYSKHKQVLDKAKNLREQSKKRYEKIDEIDPKK